MDAAAPDAVKTNSPCALPRPSELARFSVSRRSAACAELRIAVNGVGRALCGCQIPPPDPCACVNALLASIRTAHCPFMTEFTTCIRILQILGEIMNATACGMIHELFTEDCEPYLAMQLCRRVRDECAQRWTAVQSGILWLLVPRHLLLLLLLLVQVPLLLLLLLRRCLLLLSCKLRWLLQLSRLLKRV